MRYTLHKVIASICSLLIFITIVGVPLAQSQTPEEEAEAQESIVDIEDIKEQVKQRIQDVVQLDSTGSIRDTSIAYLGMLASIANNTLTIETSNGTQLASISAQTVIESLPDEDALTLDELPLDAYVVVLGTSTTSDVLSAKHIYAHDENPTEVETMVFYGVIVEHNEDENEVLLQNPHTDAQMRFEITKNTDIRYQIRPTEEEEGSWNDTFEPLKPAMILYTPSEDEDELPLSLDILIHTRVDTDQEIINRVTQATESAQPPEFQ